MNKQKKSAGRNLKSPSNSKTSSHKNTRSLSFLIFSFAFLLYANTLNHGYVLDDDVMYLKNTDVQAGFSGINSILHHSFIFGFIGHNDQSYRPVVSVIFAIEKQLFGNNPHTGHLINVLLFALSCVLLYRLMIRLFSNISFAIFPLFNVQLSFPFVIAALFAAHPIHTEAVANIKGRDDILNFIFFELSLLFTLKHIDQGSKKYFSFSVLFFFLSLLCKETAVTFLASIPLAIFFFRDIPLHKIAVGLLSFAAAFGVYMLIRSSVLETVTFAEKMKVVNNALAAATNPSDRIATALLILGKYILLLFFPHPLSWDYSFNQIPIVGFSDIKVIAILCVFVMLGIYSILIFIKRFRQPLTINHQPSAVYAFCVLFFFITMSVVSNIFILIGATLGERFLFIPSLAFCMAAPFLLNRLGKSFFIGITATVLILFSLKTFSRNKDWKDNYSLFLSGAEAAPNSSRAQTALGSSIREQAEKEADPAIRLTRYQKAIEKYKKAVVILPENTEALYNLGVCYFSIGDKENALKEYGQILKISPDHTNAANNTGVIYFEQKNYKLAEKYFLQAIQYSPSNADALGNMGAIYHNTGKLKEAIDYYQKALRVNPGNQNVQANIAKAKQALENNAK